MTPFDSYACVLGEGPLWHPGTGTLYWFDILNKTLRSRKGADQKLWTFDEHFSAAGWLNNEALLIASETALWRFSTATGEKSHLIALEADNPATRSNDGRADPWGGFWIGTMGKKGETGAGSIYRYFGGDLRRLVPNVSVSNGICFAPDRSFGYYTDTLTQKIMRVPLDPATGWPSAPASPFVDLTGTRFYPDGAVTDAAGTLWVAMWGSACVMAFARNGEESRKIEVPAKQATCPAFGGPDLRDLYVTSATDGLDQIAMQKRPLNGATFVFNDVSQGLAEPQVIL